MDFKIYVLMAFIFFCFVNQFKRDAMFCINLMLEMFVIATLRHF